MPYRYQSKIIGTAELSRNLNNSEALMNSVINQLLRTIGKIYVPVLKSLTPRVTGKLRNVTAFTVGNPGDQRLEIRQSARTRDGVFYGAFVRGGTRPHTIEPRRANALRFVVGGQVVFAMKVNHPGNKPNPYHVRALRQTQSEISAAQEAAGFKVTTELAQTGFTGTRK